MLRVRREQSDKGYIIDNGKKYLIVSEAFVDAWGYTRKDKNEWQNEPLDKIVKVKVGGEYDIEDIPEQNGTVIMSINETALGWVVLTYNFGRWNFGVKEYQPELLKCKWKVLSL